MELAHKQIDITTYKTEVIIATPPTYLTVNGVQKGNQANET